MTLPTTTTDVRFGRNAVEYDSSWRPTRQTDWFDKIINKIKDLFGDKQKTVQTQNNTNIDNV